MAIKRFRNERPRLLAPSRILRPTMRQTGGWREREELVEEARKAIAKGSKSFAVASRLFDRDTRERAWLLYCELYNGTNEQQKAALGESFGSINLQQGHARLTAYAAHRKRDAALAARAWKELSEGRSGYGAGQPFKANEIQAPAVLNPVDEAPGVSTNATAQWGLAAIECLAYARKT